MKKLTTTLLVLALAVTACGDGEQANDYPEADFTITIEHPEADTISYRIMCGADGASIEGMDLDADAACAALGDPDVQSLLIEGPPADRICTEIYGGPDVATINGTLAGQSVSTRVDRSNGCGISDWDDVLGDVLPPAIGVTG